MHLGCHESCSCRRPERDVGRMPHSNSGLRELEEQAVTVTTASGSGDVETIADPRFGFDEMPDVPGSASIFFLRFLITTRR